MVNTMNGLSRLSFVCKVCGFECKTCSKVTKCPKCGFDTKERKYFTNEYEEILFSTRNY